MRRLEQLDQRFALVDSSIEGPGSLVRSARVAEFNTTLFQNVGCAAWRFRNAGRKFGLNWKLAGHEMLRNGLAAPRSGLGAIV